MRDISSNATNELKIDDTVSGSVITVYYRQPTTEERVSYRANLWSRKGKHVVPNVEMQINKGLRIMTGFKDGDFGFDGQAISSSPQSPNFRKDWKDLLKTTAADILIALAVTAFEGVSASIGDKDDDEPKDDDDLPLASSSGD